MAETRGSARCGDAEIAWRQLGAGDPILLVNGYAATKEDWDPAFLERLAGFAELLCPDNRGMCASQLGTAELTIAGMADDLIALLDDQGIERTAVLGWSMGGFVAQQLAAMTPERVEALVLLSTDTGGPGAIRADQATWAALTDHARPDQVVPRPLAGCGSVPGRS